MKKFALIFSIVVVLILVGVGVYAILPEHDTAPTGNISLDVEDIEIKVGEEAKIEYSVSSTNLVVVMEIEDVSIAQLKSLSTGFYVVGLKEGLSILSVTASRGKEKVTKTATITVSSDSNEVIDNPKPIDDNPNPAEPDAPNDGDEEQENPVLNEIVVEFSNLFRCQYADKTFTIEVNKFSMFSICSNKNIQSINLVSQNENLKITLANDIGNDTYKMTGLIAGEYTFNLYINGYIFSYKVIVK